jgi:hypothetical protein
MYTDFAKRRIPSLHLPRAREEGEKMKTPTIRLILCFALITLVLSAPSEAGIGDFLKGLGMSVQPESLSEGKIAQGLKEALRIGARNAVDRVSRTDGYFGNPDIRIPLPNSLNKIERIVRGAGYGNHLDAFLESMNRAAEKAAPQAASLFVDAVKDMTLDDARGILKGPDDAATTYLRNKTFDRLRDVFKPEVHDAMARVEVTRRYQNLTSQLNSLPFLDTFESLDLDRHVTEKALDGLFFMIAREEQKIRQDPAARVTDLLKDVFGSVASGQ